MDVTHHLLQSLLFLPQLCQFPLILFLHHIQISCRQFLLLFITDFLVELSTPFSLLDEWFVTPDHFGEVFDLLLEFLEVSVELGIALLMWDGVGGRTRERKGFSLAVGYSHLCYKSVNRYELIDSVNAHNWINHSIELTLPLVNIDVARTVQEIGFGQVQLIKRAAFATVIGLVLYLEFFVVLFVRCTVLEFYLRGLSKWFTVGLIGRLQHFVLLVVLFIPWVSLKCHIWLLVLGVWALFDFGGRGSCKVIFIGRSVIQLSWRFESVVWYFVSGV